MFITFAVEKGNSVGSFWPTVIGAAVGGSVSLATTLLVERQRTKSAAVEHRRRLVADARLAARVIRLELADAESVLRVAIQRTPFVWPPSSGYRLPTRAWSEFSARLGAAVSDAVWEEVALPYSSFEYANLLGSVTRASAATMLEETATAIRSFEIWAQEPDVSNLPKGR
jgi:hypothetical protein